MSAKGRGSEGVSVKEHVFLRNVAVSESFSGVYFLEKVFVKVARNGNKYSDLTLRDSSGSVFARFWGEASCQPGGGWVSLTATVEEYQGNKQIVVQNIAECEEPDDLSNYSPMSETIITDKEVIQELIGNVRSYEAEFGCNVCSQIIESVFVGPVVTKFESAPASSFPCYGRIGGLLAYTARVADMACGVCAKFSLTAEEKLIALTASLLHGIGSAYAFEMVACAPQETKKGVLVGAANIGFSKVVSAVNIVMRARKKDGEDTDRDEDVTSRLMHAIVSCEPDGIKPMTREAIVLRNVVGLVREMSDASDFIANDQNAHEEFTAYDPITKRRFLKG